VALWAGGFHGENLLWHAGSVLLAFALLRRLTGALWPSFLAAALFGLHPMRVESVAWATERKDVLSVFFGLAALWAYARYAERPGVGRYLGVALALALSLLAKPMLLTLPLLLLLLDYWPLRRRASARLLLEKLPLFALAAVIGVVTMASRDRSGAAVSLDVLPLSARLANAATAYGWYLATTFWPSSLGALYPHPYGAWSPLQALGGAGLLLSLTTLTLWQARRRPWLLVGWLWFVVTLLPVIGLAQGGAQAWADRFSYWPHLGLFVAAVWGLGEVVERLRVPSWVCRSAGALILGSLGALTWVQVGYWRNAATLWERTLAVTKDNDRAHQYLSLAYRKQGRLAEAEHHLLEAGRLQRRRLGRSASLPRPTAGAERFRPSPGSYPRRPW
jgi:hypothetical protein